MGIVATLACSPSQMQAPLQVNRQHRRSRHCSPDVLKKNSGVDD